MTLWPWLWPLCKTKNLFLNVVAARGIAFHRYCKTFKLHSYHYTITECHVLSVSLRGRWKNEFGIQKPTCICYVAKTYVLCSLTSVKADIRFTTSLFPHHLTHPSSPYINTRGFHGRVASINHNSPVPLTARVTSPHRERYSRVTWPWKLVCKNFRSPKRMCCLNYVRQRLMLNSSFPHFLHGKLFTILVLPWRNHLQ